MYLHPIILGLIIIFAILTFCLYVSMVTSIASISDQLTRMADASEKKKEKSCDKPDDEIETEKETKNLTF